MMTLTLVYVYLSNKDRMEIALFFSFFSIVTIMKLLQFVLIVFSSITDKLINVGDNRYSLPTVKAGFLFK